MYIKNGFLHYEDSYLQKRKKKITGHSFVALAGLDIYNKPGDAVLSMLKIYSSEVDPKYLARGNYAEKMVGLVLKSQGKEVTYYDEQYKKAHYYDCFPRYNSLGGIPDFEIFKESLTVEVKSKSMKKYEEIKSEIPISELYQGLFYCYLREHRDLKMAYVFFDEETENQIFNKQIPTTLNNCKLLFKKYTCNREELKQLIDKAIMYYNICIANKSIPVKDISPKVLNALQLDSRDDV